MPKWEYYCEPLGQNIDRANELGVRGWELVAVHNGVFWFKRRAEHQAHGTRTTP